MCASPAALGYLRPVQPIAFGSVLLCALGVALAWLRVVPALAGFGLFALGGLGSLLAALVAVGRLLRGRTPGVGGVLALLVAAAFVASAVPGFGLPRINDFTTDLDDPPAFVHAATLGANVGRDLSYPPAWAELQRECCSDLRAAVLDVPTSEAYGRALALVQALPRLEVTARDPAAGTLEAVATTMVFGFRDDVVMRVRPSMAGGARIDIRSKSRDGQGDVGANAARIRMLVAALEGGA